MENKLKKRDPKKLKELYNIDKVKCHPVFCVVPGDIEKWERV